MEQQPVLVLTEFQRASLLLQMYQIAFLARIAETIDKPASEKLEGQLTEALTRQTPHVAKFLAMA